MKVVIGLQARGAQLKRACQRAVLLKSGSGRRRQAAGKTAGTGLLPVVLQSFQR